MKYVKELPLKSAKPTPGSLPQLLARVLPDSRSEGQRSNFGVTSSFESTRKCIQVSGVPTPAVPPSWVNTCHGKRPSLSSAHIRKLRPTCLRLLIQEIRWPLALALARAGRSIPARMPMMAITTSSSIKVKAAKAGLRSVCFIIPIIRIFISNSSSTGPFCCTQNGPAVPFGFTQRCVHQNAVSLIDERAALIFKDFCTGVTRGLQNGMAQQRSPSWQRPLCVPHLFTMCVPVLNRPAGNWPNALSYLLVWAVTVSMRHVRIR